MIHYLNWRIHCVNWVIYFSESFETVILNDLKAQQRLYFLRQLRKFNLLQELLIQFYSAIIESVLCSSITVWFGSATKTDIRRLQRTVRTAERIIGAPLPSLQELYTSRVRKRAKKVTLEPLTPSSLSLYCCPLAGATDHWAQKQPDTRIVFFPQVVSHLNNT